MFVSSVSVSECSLSYGSRNEASFGSYFLPGNLEIAMNDDVERVVLRFSIDSSDAAAVAAAIVALFIL